MYSDYDRSNNGIRRLQDCHLSSFLHFVVFCPFFLYKEDEDLSSKAAMQDCLESASVRHLPKCMNVQGKPERCSDMYVSCEQTSSDGGPWEHHKCSGLLVSTGTGSSAWMAEAIALSPQVCISYAFFS